MDLQFLLDKIKTVTKCRCHYEYDRSFMEKRLCRITSDNLLETLAYRWLGMCEILSEEF